MRTLILITVACSAVALILNLINLELVNVGICAVAIVIGVYMLRHPSTWRRGDRRD